jgi:WD40 repeat protein
MGGKLQTIPGRHVSGVTGIVFNPKDNELATSGFDWLVKISVFPLTEEKPETIESHDLWIYGIRFMPDNKHLVSFSADKTISVVSTQNDDMAQKLKQTLKRNMTREEWKRMVGDDIPYQKTFENLP